MRRPPRRRPRSRDLRPLLSLAAAATLLVTPSPAAAQARVSESASSLGRDAVPAPVAGPGTIPAPGARRKTVPAPVVSADTVPTPAAGPDTIPGRVSRPDTIPGSHPAPAPGARRHPPLADEAVLLVSASVHALSAPLRWSGREWALATASVGAVALASTLDESGRDLMADARSDRNTSIELFIEPFGAERSLQLMGGMLVAGLLLDDVKLRATAVEGLAAGLVAGGIITPTLQLMIGRAKPRAGLPAHTFDPFGGDRSLPSGHTTQAFAIASVLATEYEHPLIRVGAYGMATAVGVSRMYRRSHFLSDVVGAAIIGTAVGTTVARYGIDRRSDLSVTPYIADGSPGLVLRLSR